MFKVHLNFCGIITFSNFSLFFGFVAFQAKGAFMSTGVTFAGCK